MKQPGRENVMKRFAKQTTQVFKAICSAKSPKVRCYGTQPSRPDGRDHKGCGRWVRIDMAYKCLYCEFYFCEKCAEIHFGKTKEEHILEMKAAGEYIGIL